MKIRTCLKLRRKRKAHDLSAENPVITSMSARANIIQGVRGEAQEEARGGARYQQQQQRDGSSYGRGNGGYQGRGAGQRGRSGQQQQDHQSAGQGATTFATELEVSTDYSVEANNCENYLEWVLDSGCSDHIINDDKYFVKVSKLDKPVNVKVGDGRVLKATSIGEIKQSL